MLRECMRRAGLSVDRLEYMNLVGTAGWFLNGRIRDERELDPRQVKLFDGLLPLIRLEDRLRLLLG